MRTTYRWRIAGGALLLFAGIALTPPAQAPAAGGPTGVSTLLVTVSPGTPGSYLHCVVSVESAGGDDLTGALACYPDAPKWSPALATPPPWPADGAGGPPPPPPYTMLPPAPLEGMYSPSTGEVTLSACFQNVAAPASLAPNVIWSLTYDAKSGAGTADLYGAQSVMECQALTPYGSPAFAGVTAQLTPEGPAFDRDADGCTDAQELAQPPASGCGDDPYNPHDGPAAIGLAGSYDALFVIREATVCRNGQPEPDCTAQPDGALRPGTFIACRSVVTAALAVRTFCYLDSPQFPVNTHATPQQFGDGLAGAPPPYSFAEVPTPAQGHTVLSGVFDSGSGELEVVGCSRDDEHDASLGAVYAEYAQDARTGLGHADLWTGQPDGCAGSPVGLTAYANTPLLSARQSESLTHDSDRDGCSDLKELGDSVLAGGLRDPFNPWDFFDPTGATGQPDRSVSGFDFFSVLSRFNATGDPLSDPQQRPIPPAPGYHVVADRGTAPVPGSNGWNLQRPDGSIAGGDLFAVLAQFNHAC